MTMSKGWEPKNDDVGLKQWKVDRIDYILQTVLEETRSFKDYFVTRFTENIPKATGRRRNQILAAVAFAVTLIISVKDFSQMSGLNWLNYRGRILQDYKAL